LSIVCRSSVERGKMVGAVTHRSIFIMNKEW
jgi:hypothetical protein